MQNGKQVSLSFLLMSFAATGTIWWSILARGLGRAIKNYLVKLHAPTSLLGKFLLRCQKKYLQIQECLWQHFIVAEKL